MHTGSYQHTVVGVEGKIHTYYGCSVVGWFEFEAILSEIDRHAREHGHSCSLEELYRADAVFRGWVDRALELNGIQVRWLRWQQIQELLFWRAEGEEIRLPVLIEINRPQSYGSASNSGKPATLPEVISAISQSSNASLKEAFEIAGSQSIALVLDTLMAQSKLAERQAASQPNAISQPNAMATRPQDIKSITKTAKFRDWARQQRQDSVAGGGAE